MLGRSRFRSRVRFGGQTPATTPAVEVVNDAGLLVINDAGLIVVLG
jgi:hypothetical protein